MSFSFQIAADVCWGSALQNGSKLCFMMKGGDFLNGCDRFRSGQFPAKLFFLANVILVCQRRLWMERKNRFAYQKDLILKYWHMRRTQPLTQSNSARKPELYIPVPLLNGWVRWGTCMYSLPNGKRRKWYLPDKGVMCDWLIRFNWMLM